MLWVLLPLICGVVAASHLNFSILIPAIILIVSSVLLLLRQHIAFIYPILICWGYIITSHHLPTAPLERQFGTTVALHVGDTGEVQLISERQDDGSWSNKREKLLWFGAVDSLHHKNIICRGDLLPLIPTNNYMRSMQRKGFAGVFRLREVVAVDSTMRTPLSFRLNDWAMERLSRLSLTQESAASAAAMALARREGLSKELRGAYSRSGTAHLLALSGLHIGVVVLIISTLGYLLPLLHNGHIWADVTAIVAIWLFALMAGLGDSVMRAAWMFSLLKFASLISRQYNSLNSLFVAAVAILCFDPLALYDLSFRLSFVAVAAIILVGMPLTSLLRSGYMIVDFVVASVVISLVATLATAPLISHSFGYIALLSPLTTLPLLVTMTTIVLMSVIWVLFPLPLLAQLFGEVIEVAATLQNFAVRWFASWEWGAVNYQISNGGLYIAYALTLVIVILSSHLLHQQLKAREKVTEVAKAKVKEYI